MTDEMTRMRIAWRAARGFTLIEVMAALAILGAGLFILLDAHYSALLLHQMTVEEAFLRERIEGVAATAELGIYEEKLSDSGDFGMRYPDFAWSYEANLVGEASDVPLYRVNVTVNGPNEEKSLAFYVYNIGVQEAKGTSRPMQATGRSR